MVRGRKAGDERLGGRERGGESQNVGQALGGFVCLRGGQALEIRDGKGSGDGFYAGDPDDPAMLGGRAEKKRSQEVR